MSEYFSFPAQKLPVLAHADVVVAGAGAAGVAAAILMFEKKRQDAETV